MVADPAPDQLRAFDPRDLSDMVEMGVDDEQGLAGRPVAEARPARDARIGGVPALAGAVGRMRQPAGARGEEGEAVGEIDESRLFARLHAGVAGAAPRQEERSAGKKGAST